MIELLLFWVVTFIVSYSLTAVLNPIYPFKTYRQSLPVGVSGLVFVFLICAWYFGPRFANHIFGISTPRSVAESTRSAPMLIHSRSREYNPDLGLSSLTHMHGNLNQRVTYSQPLNIRIYKDEVAEDVWTVSSDYIDVVCFADGNNAIITRVGGQYYAQNGKAKQFVRFSDGDGLRAEDGRLIQIQETNSPIAGRLHHAAITAGYEMCPQKSIEEIVAAVRAAAEGGPPQTHDLNTLAGVQARMEEIGGPVRKVILAKMVESVGHSCNAITRDLHVGNMDNEVWYAVKCDTGTDFMITIKADGKMSVRITDCTLLAAVGQSCFQKLN